MSLIGRHVPEPRKNAATETISEEDFRRRFLLQFKDPYFDPFRAEISRMADVAWKAHGEGRKAPVTRPAGPGYADPSYELADDWTAAKRAVEEAGARHADPVGKSRVLVINGSSRNRTTCPGEDSKTRRLCDEAMAVLKSEGFEAELLDLSLVTSEFGRTIHPCKSCASTAMPLCHWPCSCYPNYALGQANDWMNEIYPMWVAAHGILIITPVNWYQSPGPLKAMMDRLVCADGGNPDQTSTHGKDAKKAKELELAGWDFPKHLAGRIYSIITHGDAAGIDNLRNSLADWLNDMHLLPAGLHGTLARYVGYYEPYATSHEALEKDKAFHQEVEGVVKGLTAAVRGARAGKYRELADAGEEPRPK
jgi:multimeric flavodoxin WrbA